MIAANAARCPGCGALAQEKPDPDGGVQCAFCGVRFQVGGAIVSGQTPRKSPAYALAGAAGLVAAALVALGLASAYSGRETSSRPPMEVLPPTSAGAETSGPLSASFALHSRRPSVESSFMLYGEATNTSTSPISTVEVVAVLRDAKGGELRTYNGYSIDDELAPEARSPVRILIKDPPEHDHIDFEVFARPLTYKRPRAEGLSAQSDATEEQGVFRRLRGTVQNGGTASAKLVKITVIGRGSAGEVLGIGESFAKDREILPGQSSRWDMLVNFGPATEYQVRVSGWPVTE